MRSIVGDHDGEHHQRLEGPAVRALEPPGGERDDDGAEQQVHERAVQLGE
jgi:hypothetical protein